METGATVTQAHTFLIRLAKDEIEYQTPAVIRCDLTSSRFVLSQRRNTMCVSVWVLVCHHGPGNANCSRKLPRNVEYLDRNRNNTTNEVGCEEHLVILVRFGVTAGVNTSKESSSASCSVCVCVSFRCSCCGFPSLTLGESHCRRLHCRDSDFQPT